MKLIIDISDDTFNILKNMLESDCVDPYSLADIIVNKSIPIRECEFLSTLMQSAMTTEQLKEVFQKMVEEKNRWIPVSERLPEQANQSYLVTVDYGNDLICACQGFFFNPEIGWNDVCVIAWQPLPEPYKDGEEE